MKNSDFHNYVIKNGKFIGNFEEMYQHFKFPWDQKDRELFQSEKAIIINHLKKIGKCNVIELGCGLGYFTEKIRQEIIKESKILGIDISKTAIKKAKKRFPKCFFQVADVLDFQIYQKFNPDVIVMSQISWYILPKLKKLLDYLKNNFPDIIIIHTLVTYTNEDQKYGREFFTNMDEILRFFDMNYLEKGSYSESSDNTRTGFVANFKKDNNKLKNQILVY